MAIALLKFCKQLHRFQFLVRLQKELDARLALSLIQMLRECIDTGMEFFAGFQVWGALQDSNRVLADHYLLRPSNCTRMRRHPARAEDRVMLTGEQDGKTEFVERDPRL